MSALYLITGFLGAGKTTFLKNFAPLFQGKRLAVIVNEFGRENVDEKLLASLRAALYGVTGGSIFCSCRLDQFEKVLAEAVEGAPDVILVETSGLTDPTGVRGVLAGARFRGIDYKGCVCLADATRLFKLYETASVIRKQLRAADLVLLNKCDLATGDDLAKSRDILAANGFCENVLETSHCEIPEAWAERMMAMRPLAAGDALITNDIALHRMSVEVDRGMTRERLERFLRAFARETYRMKGFVRLNEGAFRVDCVGEDVKIWPAREDEVGENRIAVLYGHGLKAAKAARVAAGEYTGEILTLE